MPSQWQLGHISTAQSGGVHSTSCPSCTIRPRAAPDPATSLPFVKSSCPQPNPLMLSLSHYSIFKLMPGQAWDRRKLTLGNGSSLHNASYHLKHCSLPFSHSICRGDTGSTTITVSITQAQALSTHLCWWGGKSPLRAALYLGGCKVPRRDCQLCLGLHQKQPAGTSMGAVPELPAPLLGHFGVPSSGARSQEGFGCWWEAFVTPTTWGAQRSWSG